MSKFTQGMKKEDNDDKKEPVEHTLYEPYIILSCVLHERSCRRTRGHLIHNLRPSCCEKNPVAHYGGFAFLVRFVVFVLVIFFLSREAFVL